MAIEFRVRVRGGRARTVTVVDTETGETWDKGSAVDLTFRMRQNLNPRVSIEIDSPHVKMNGVIHIVIEQEE